MSIMEKIEATRKKMNYNYDIRVSEVRELLGISGGGQVDLLYNAFVYGYMKGERAAKAARRS